MKKSQDSLYNATYGIWATQIGQGTDNNADAYTLQVQNKWKTGNAWFYQVYGDFAVSQKLKLGAALAYAYADKKPSASYVSKKYGLSLMRQCRTRFTTTWST